MSGIKVCDIGDDIIAVAKKLRFRKDKNNAAFIIKINMGEMKCEIEEELEDCSIEEVKDELPDFSPRYICLSYCYHHDDGRISFPLMFIYYCPGGVKPDHNMVYASVQPDLVQKTNMTKVFELRDSDDFDEDWVKQKLGFFR
eukprot:m.465408 g.465408  ORF g.465408 m.465408 type:complete len:142 (-) comp21628_c0_seq10:130-555(-)